MAAQDGEERLMIVFADVHYYFQPPSSRPTVHRFDKGSYLYLYGNKSGSGARIEVANHAGTPEQDAFTGALDTAVIRQSYKHQTLCTLTVDGMRDYSASEAQPAYYWQLPTIDSRTGASRALRLHTIDFYFWTVTDAQTFIDHVVRLLQRDQVDLLDMPPTRAAPDKAVSPLVQHLENAAISDSSPRTSSRQNVEAQGPPRSQESPQTTSSTTSFQPLAYNPAAPAAPEPIRHREKTPPPVDAETGTGLTAATYADQASIPPQSSLSRPPYGQMPSSQRYVPQASSQIPSAVASGSMPSAVQPAASSVGSLPPPPPLSPPNQSSVTQQLPKLGSPQHVAGPPNPDSNVRAPPSPASQILGNAQPGVHQPMQHVQPHYTDYLGVTGHQSPGPIGGYSNYSYTQQQPQSQQNTDNYDLHSQVYRPTQDEAKYDKRQQRVQDGQTQGGGKVDQSAGRVDKGVNRLFKRIEKKIG